MYGNDDHTLIGYPYTDHLPLLDLTSAQPNISPECLTTAYSGEHTKGYNNYNKYTHSLQKNAIMNNNVWFSRMGLVTEAECESNSVGRVFSTGDLQINAAQCYSRSESPLSSESSSIIESMSRAYPYSPEEKKERIERYRSKRSQRNFTKKIKYECRKTLADSRPRVRGRFARNDEVEKSSQSSEWSHEFVKGDDVDQDNWLKFLDSFPANLIS